MLLWLPRKLSSSRCNYFLKEHCYNCTIEIRIQSFGTEKFDFVSNMANNLQDVYLYL